MEELPHRHAERARDSPQRGGPQPRLTTIAESFVLHELAHGLLVEAPTSGAMHCVGAAQDTKVSPPAIGDEGLEPVGRQVVPLDEVLPPVGPDHAHQVGSRLIGRLVDFARAVPDEVAILVEVGRPQPTELGTRFVECDPAAGASQQ